MSEDAGYIYAIGVTGTLHVKVGLSRVSVENRLAALQISHPLPLSILYTSGINSRLVQVEQHMHALLAPYHVRSEWFELALTEEMFDDFVKQAILKTEIQQENITLFPLESHPSKRTTPIKSLRPATPVSTKTMGGRIRVARERFGWSQNELAKRAVVRQALISDLENGKQDDTTGITLKKLASTLIVTVDYLVGMYQDDYLIPLPPIAM